MRVHRSAFALAALVSLVLPGCGGFYYQAVTGHMDLMAERRPIQEVIEDPQTDQALAARLRLILAARRFAVDALYLPDNDSYTSFAQLDRPYVVWNVFAAPELSLEPRQWCFPVAGCVVYRGYFKEASARRYADRLARDGWDVFVGGAAAYSTLGRFDDPVVSTMLRWDDTGVVAILFHELAHQRLYVPGDSAFNEAFATAVEEFGIERWLDSRSDPEALDRYRIRKGRENAFNRLLWQTREELVAVFASGAGEESMREEKRRVFDTLRERYQALRASWAGYPGYDAWFESELNNARLIPVSTYQRLVPAFRALLRRSDGDLKAFYRECQSLADMSKKERDARLESLLAISDGPESVSR